MRIKIFRNTGFLLLLILVISCGTKNKKNIETFPDYGKVIAFPGAEGFGRFATGGRGGEIYHVTNLKDSGKGSLRDAVSQSNRFIVFDVAGIIELKSALLFSSNITVAAQTAPGDGVVLYGNQVSFSGQSNIVCRYLRVRLGIQGPEGRDAAGIADNGRNMIFDHMSVTWGQDENFSINSESARDITIQNSIIGQGLQNHSCGGLIQTSIEHGVTLYRNLYIDNKTRNPKVKGLNQFVNNVIYNWGNGAAYNMGGNSKRASLTTIEDNYFIVGPALNWQNVRQEDNSIQVEKVSISPTKPFIGGNELFSTYCKQNYYDFDKNGTLNGVEIIPENNLEHFESTPAFLNTRPNIFPEITQQMNATDTYHWIVAHGGASLPVRDEVDHYLIDELTSLGEKGTIIQNEQDTQQFSLGGPGRIKTAEKPLDSDNDGMPDAFEEQYGLDKTNASDASKIADNGYTNIENYTFILETKLN
ncbi:hypothetical protein QLS71_014400 [Mariniflexile litorale]|uniref:Pectate lyase n=1 Tax=Mariniflexile litorale TaxID=3045158 RepID=A0AAU7EDI1_9FLAO|nr:hypothetical protein [Mariniflexile sp. KMM 9835]MDQ8212885.1 hypothetical protein [Mariniflexile sp. KMM 9835]